jgi:hypothetical protein
MTNLFLQNLRTSPSLLVLAALCACDVPDETTDDPDAAHEAALEAEAVEAGHPDGHDEALNYSADYDPTVEAISCEQSTGTGYVDGNPFTIELVKVDGKPVEIATANAFWVMQQKAASQGVNIAVVSGFRTMAEQQYLYSCYVNCSCNSCNLAAKPGYSNHQSGHALDLNTGAPGVLAWLKAHGSDYGFTATVASEAWHWEWWGGGPGGGACGVEPEPPPPPPPPPRRLISSNNRDYNGDGRDDIFWYAPGEHADPLWLGASGKTFSETFAPNVQSLYLTIAGDYNGDGRSDVFFYAPGELPEAVWNGTAAGSFNKSVPKNSGGTTIAVNGSYSPIGGDFNGDGKDDIFWYAPGATEDSLWYGLGGNKFANAPVNVDGSYLPIGGDFDGDGRTDILWYGAAGLPESVWYGRANTTGSFDQTSTTDVSGWYLPFAGDFNGDGRDDIFWYAPGEAADHLWNGTAARSFSHSQPLKPGGTAWNVQGDFQAIPGDFNGDGRSDILWYGSGADPDSIFYATSNGRFESGSVAISGVYAPV